MSQFTQVAVKELQPHPSNYSIYGDDDVTHLVELISDSNWVKPLLCTPHNVIISGHRRWKAACLLEWETVSVEYREFPDETAELEALLLENASRFKTAEQKVREAITWKKVEASKAKKRQVELAGSRPNTEPDLCENFRTGVQGRTVDILACRVGLGSGRNYEKAAKVVRAIDSFLQSAPETALVLRKILNEQSVDGAYGLLKKSTPELTQITNLIASGKAKSPRQAVKMINLNNEAAKKSEDAFEPSQPSFAGFSVGDWVEINSSAHEHNLTYIGQRGRIEQILAAEKLLSVSVEDGTNKVRFEPCELNLLVKSAPTNPIALKDIVFVRIDRHEAASPQEKKWNGFWGQVTQVGQMGSINVDVGSESLQLFPRDLTPVEQQSAELRQVVERVLRLRSLELDEFEKGILDMFQRREWFKPRQLALLDFIEKFYIKADDQTTENHQVV